MKTEMKVALIAAAGAVIAALIAAAWPNKSEPGGIAQTGSGNSNVQIGTARDVAVHIAQPAVPDERPCVQGDLALSMEDHGNLIPGMRGGSGNRFASGRLYQFTLTNTASSCTVIVENIELAVLAHIADEHVVAEATTATNHYEAMVSVADVGRSVQLIPLKGAPRVKWGFSYPPKSLPDRFAVHVVPKEWGHSYVVQLRVRWFDPKSTKRFTTSSAAYAAFFPEGKGNDPLAILSGSSSTWKFREEERAKWSKQLGFQVL